MDLKFEGTANLRRVGVVLKQTGDKQLKAELYSAMNHAA